MLAALTGSYIAYRNGNLSVYWLSLISLTIAFIITLFFVEPTIVNGDKEVSYLQCINEAFSFLKNNNSIRFVILFGIIVGAVFTYIDEFWQIYLNEINIPVFLFGAVSSIRMFSSSVSGLYSHRLKRRFSYSTILSFVLVFICLSILFTSFIQNAWGLIPLVLTFAVFGLVEPIVLGYLHHRTDSSIRATVESFQSLALRICTILCGLIFGYFSTHYSIFTGFKVLGIILLVYLIYYFCSVRKNLSSY